MMTMTWVVQFLDREVEEALFALPVEMALKRAKEVR
jgi:hypothetical protein